MTTRSPQSHGTIHTGVEYWPSYVDILTTVLMVFLLQSFLQTTMNVDNLEAARIRQAQDALRKAMMQEFAAEVANHKIGLESKPKICCKSVLVRRSSLLLEIITWQVADETFFCGALNCCFGPTLATMNRLKFKVTLIINHSNVRYTHIIIGNCLPLARLKWSNTL